MHISQSAAVEFIKLAIAREKNLALVEIAEYLKRLGLNDAATQMGAIEGLGLCVKEGLDRLAGVVENLSDPHKHL